MSILEKEFASTGQSEPGAFAGHFNISVHIGSGTVVLQRSFNGGQRWLDITTFTASYEDTMFDPEGAQYRFVCTGFVSDVYCRLGQ